MKKIFTNIVLINSCIFGYFLNLKEKISEVTDWLRNDNTLILKTSGGGYRNLVPQNHQLISSLERVKGP